MSEYVYDSKLAQGALEHAIELAGTARALAAELGISPQRLSDMRIKLSAGKQIPPLWAIEIEKKYGINRSIFRPELWPLDLNKHE